jgi:hypothetical protein
LFVTLPPPSLRPRNSIAFFALSTAMTASNITRAVQNRKHSSSDTNELNTVTGDENQRKMSSVNARIMLSELRKQRKHPIDRRKPNESKGKEEIGRRWRLTVE